MPIRRRSVVAEVRVRTNPADFVMSQFIVPKTTVEKNTDGSFKQFTTVLPDGVKIGWTNCGRCLQAAPWCTCRDIIHPSSIEWCWIRARMNKDGIPEARERLPYDAPVILERALYWYKRPRPSSSLHAIVADESVNRPIKPRPALPIPGPITKRGKVIARPRKKIKSLAEKDRDRFDEQAADVMAKDRKRVLKRVESEPEPKRIRRIKR